MLKYLAVFSGFGMLSAILSLIKDQEKVMNARREEMSLL